MNNDAAGVVIATLRSHLETATAENERLREELTAARAQATVDVAAGNAGARITADAAAALETARKALEADADQFHAVGMFRNEQRVRAALRALDTPAATPEVCGTCQGVKRWFDEMSSTYVPCTRCGKVNPR